MGEIISSITDSSAFKAISMVSGVALFAFAAMLLFWMFKDASERDSKPAIWLGVGVVLAIVGAVAGTMMSKTGILMPGLFSALAVLVLYIIYKLVRPTDYSEDLRERDLSLLLLEAELDNKSCPHCHRGVEIDYLICPECRRQLRVPCNYCGKPIKQHWVNCPYCTSRQTD